MMARCGLAVERCPPREFNNNGSLDGELVGKEEKLGESIVLNLSRYPDISAGISEFTLK